jgi:hypothetical protein
MHGWLAGWLLGAMVAQALDYSAHSGPDFCTNTMIWRVGLVGKGREGMRNPWCEKWTFPPLFSLAHAASAGLGSVSIARTNREDEDTHTKTYPYTHPCGGRYYSTSALSVSTPPSLRGVRYRGDRSLE